MIRTTVLILVFCFCFSKSSHSQTEFFRSQQQSSEKISTNYYSSLRVNDSMLYFSANDYKLYVYNRNTLKLRWSSSTGYKANRPGFIHDSLVFVPYYSDKTESTAILDNRTGDLIRVLPFGPLGSVPVVRNGILYCTAIYEGGTILAYDIRQDSVLWYRFLAHGFSTQPYFFPDHIMANAEGNNWVKLDYNGALLNNKCKDKADIFVSDIPCVDKFCALTGDGVQISEKFARKEYGNDESIYPENLFATKNHSYVLHDNTLLVIGKRGKRIARMELESLEPDAAAADTSSDYGVQSKIIDASEDAVTMLYHHVLVTYNHRKREVVKRLDLSFWQPHQVIMDKNRLWVISKKDGLLYGLTMD